MGDVWRHFSLSCSVGVLLAIPQCTGEPLTRNPLAPSVSSALGEKQPAPIQSPTASCEPPPCCLGPLSGWGGSTTVKGCPWHVGSSHLFWPGIPGDHGWRRAGSGEGNLRKPLFPAPRLKIPGAMGCHQGSFGDSGPRLVYIVPECDSQAVLSRGRSPHPSHCSSSHDLDLVACVRGECWDPSWGL